MLWSTPGYPTNWTSGKSLLDIETPVLVDFNTTEQPLYFQPNHIFRTEHSRPHIWAKTLWKTVWKILHSESIKSHHAPEGAIKTVTVSFWGLNICSTSWKSEATKIIRSHEVVKQSGPKLWARLYQGKTNIKMSILRTYNLELMSLFKLLILPIVSLTSIIAKMQTWNRTVCASHSSLCPYGKNELLAFAHVASFIKTGP